MKSRFSTFNDGVLFICKPESDHSTFNAVKNPKKKTELDKTLKLNYDEMSRREQDLQFAESQGRNLTLKVKTRLRSQVTKFHQVLIEDMLYSIIDLDIDRDRSEMYLYLEEVRKLS